MTTENVREQMHQIAAANIQTEVLHQFELSPRYAVRIAELNGSDETIVIKLLGKEFTATGVGAVRYRNALLGRSIKQFNHDPEMRDIDSPERQAMWVNMDQKKSDRFLENLRLQEKEKLGVGYDTLNGVDESEREKVKNSLTPTMTT